MCDRVIAAFKAVTAPEASTAISPRTAAAVQRHLLERGIQPPALQQDGRDAFADLDLLELERGDVQRELRVQTSQSRKVDGRVAPSAALRRGCRDGRRPRHRPACLTR